MFMTFWSIDFYGYLNSDLNAGLPADNLLAKPLRM